MATPPKRSCPSPATSSEGTHIKKISIEGNIAAGKSTFVNILKQVCEDWEVVPEPVARWCNVQSTQNEFEEESIYFEHELPGSVQGYLLGLELRKGFKQKIFHALKVCKIKDLHIFTRHLFGSEITEKADEASLTH